MVLSIFPCAILYIRYTKYRRVMKHHLQLIFHRDKCGDRYDANILYDSDDEEVRHWGIQELLLTLEQQYGYRLYIEERDGPIGVPVNEGIHQTIANSQRSIIVLSQNITQHRWKLDAINQAFFCWRYFENHKLIFVKYKANVNMAEEDTGEKTELYAVLKLGLAINRETKHFWRQIISKMPKKQH